MKNRLADTGPLVRKGWKYRVLFQIETTNEQLKIIQECFGIYLPAIPLLLALASSHNRDCPYDCSPTSSPVSCIVGVHRVAPSVICCLEDSVTRLSPQSCITDRIHTEPTEAAFAYAGRLLPVLSPATLFRCRGSAASAVPPNILAGSIFVRL